MNEFRSSKEPQPITQPNCQTNEGDLSFEERGVSPPVRGTPQASHGLTAQRESPTPTPKTSSHGTAHQWAVTVMEIDQSNLDHNREEEYVLLDLDAVCGQVDIPPDEPYVLSSLDTTNPVLTIGNKLKLIGEYKETIGTCLIFSENEKRPSYHGETGSTEANNFKNDRIVDPNLGPSKHIRPVTSLHKILKFRLLSEADGQNSTEKPADPLAQADDPT